MLRCLAALLMVGALLATSASAECVEFYDGLCPGPNSCKCTLNEACGTRRPIEEVRTASGGCSGSCMTVDTGDCPGDALCLKPAGSCGAPPPPAPPGPGPSPSRDAIIACAKSWADQQIPYCQCNGPEECCGNCPYCGSFRCDCSGYVSFCLGLSYGYVTSTLPEVTHQIDQSELLPGDIMLCAGDHVVFFAGWSDSSQSSYVCYQEPGCHTEGPHYAFESVVPYPFNWNPSCFLPYRLNGLRNRHSPLSNLAPKDVLLKALMHPQSFPRTHQADADKAEKIIAPLREAAKVDLK